MRKRGRPRKYREPRPVGRPRIEKKKTRCKHQRIDVYDSKDVKSNIKKISAICGINSARLAKCMIVGILHDPERIPGIDFLMRTLREMERG